MSGVDVSARRGLPGLAYPERYLHTLADELAERFTGTFARETVERCVLESYAALLRTSTVTTHLPSRVTRFAADRLTALALATGALPRQHPEVLFVCVHNAGRSQMAAALTTQLSRGRVHVRSAGSQPADALDAGVIDVMRELGIDIGGPDSAYPKPLTDDVVQAADVVVTMGCGDACPLYPGKRYEDWGLSDPDGRTLDEVRAVRDEIVQRVRDLLDSLGIPRD